jgi:hypothetical protein
MGDSLLFVRFVAIYHLVLLTLLCSATGSALAYQYPFHVERTNRGAAIDLALVNDGPAPINVIIELTSAKNTGFTPAVIGKKYPHILKPFQTKKITTAVPLLLGKEAYFTFITTKSFGDSYAIPNLKYVYRLPIADNQRGVVRPYTGFGISNNFVNTTNAVEVLMPVGSPVVAARDGIVIDARGIPGDPDNTLPSPIGNFVSVLHEDGAWATYAWLADGSVAVKPGDTLKAGQQIGLSASNPDSIDSYIMFTVNRNLFGMQLGSVPVQLASAGGVEFDVLSYTGPVSPNLGPKYKLPDPDEEPWQPSESIMPPPKPPIDWNDEHLAPRQRQILFRQRMEEASASSNSDTISGSRPLIFLAVAAALLGTIGAAFAISGSKSPQQTSGVRGILWSMFRGSPPTGRDRKIDESELTEMDPRHSNLIASSSSKDATDVSSQEKNKAIEQSDGTPVENETPDDPVPPSSHKHVMSADHLNLFSLISQCLNDKTLCTPAVPLHSLVVNAPQDDANVLVDFVLVDVESGDTVGAIIFSCDEESKASRLKVAHQLSVAGVPTVTFEAMPKRSEIKARLKRLI